MTASTDGVVELTPERIVSLVKLAEDGYTYAATRRGAATYLARTPGALVAMDIDGYGDLPDTDEGRDHAFAMRHDRLVLLANLFQRSLVDVAVENGTLALDSESDDVLIALHRDKAVPFEGIPTVPVRSCLIWRHGVPLVLIATDYWPSAPREQPTGNIVWVDPSSEMSFLRSVAGMGLYDVMVYGEDNGWGMPAGRRGSRCRTRHQRPSWDDPAE